MRGLVPNAVRTPSGEIRPDVVAHPPRFQLSRNARADGNTVRKAVDIAHRGLRVGDPRDRGQIFRGLIPNILYPGIAAIGRPHDLPFFTNGATRVTPAIAASCSAISS